MKAQTSLQFQRKQGCLQVSEHTEDGNFRIDVHLQACTSVEKLQNYSVGSQSLRLSIVFYQKSVASLQQEI